jgi:prepilin-type processing-associated H-X9-DG protein
MAQSLYIVDYGAYPFTGHDDLFWYFLLQPYGLGQVEGNLAYTDHTNFAQLRTRNTVILCPTATYPGAAGGPNPLFDYGRNEYGFDFAGMGLGRKAVPSESETAPTLYFAGTGLGRKAVPMGVSTIRQVPVLENEVANPSEMIAFSDAAVRLTYAPRLLDLGRFWLGTDPFSSAVVPNATRVADKRHNRQLNLAFADNHVEPLKIDKLFFSTNDADRRIWFRDNQPHPEWIRY